MKQEDENNPLLYVAFLIVIISILAALFSLGFFQIYGVL